MLLLLPLVASIVAVIGVDENEDADADVDIPDENDELLL